MKGGLFGGPFGSWFGFFLEGPFRVCSGFCSGSVNVFFLNGLNG